MSGFFLACGEGEDAPRSPSSRSTARPSFAGLGRYFGSTPETWLGMQMAYDLWQARARADEIKVNRFEAA